MANASVLAIFATMIRLSHFLCILVFGLLTGSSGVANGQKILVAAASDLKFALDSIITIYKQTNPRSTVQVTYGSSGKLYEQIRRGAPFDMFFSADLVYPEQLRQQNHCLGNVVQYGVGRLVVWSNRKDIVASDMSILANPKIRKVAIANPLHAPYGKRAVESLIHFNLYSALKPKLVYGENISQTAQFLTTGAADAGVIALSLALSPAMQPYNGTYFLVPQDSHQRLEQGYVILRNAKDKTAVTEFASFFGEESSRGILTYFGFLNMP
jgi:molybdate transport system substrate-binding protein